MPDAIAEWIKALESHYHSIWQRNDIPTDNKHSFIVSKDSRYELIHPEIRDAVRSLNIRFHSSTNPKSSQLLALNLFLLGHKCGDSFFNELFSDPSIQNVNGTFEWIDELNTLQQGGNPSNHDVLLDCGKKKYLVEMKFTEHGDAPCGSSKRDEECLKRMSELHCPLETNYGTRYYPFLRGTDSPYDIDKLGSQYPDCPFMHGEQYQIMRYILLCHARSVSSEIWTSVIIFPRKNQFMDEEIKLTMNCLKDSTTLKRIYLEDAVGIMRNFNEGYADWLSERYII